MPFNTYIDESERSNYLLVGVNVPHSQIHPIRQVMRDLRTADSLHIHMYRESRGRQKHIAQTITSLRINAWIISVSSQTARDPIARNLALQNIGQLESMRESRLITLDYINRHRADNSILREIAQNSDFQFPHYRHMNSRHEPLLWLPDIIAWCYGRGGTWRDAVEPLVAEVIEI